MKATLIRSLAILPLALAPAGYLIAQTAKIESPGIGFAPWDPARIAERRKEYGFVGPGPQAKYPEARFPAYLKKPQSAAELVPLARAAVTQTGGRVPPGLANAGAIILIALPWYADA